VDWLSILLCICGHLHWCTVQCIVIYVEYLVPVWAVFTSVDSPPPPTHIHRATCYQRQDVPPSLNVVNVPVIAACHLKVALVDTKSVGKGGWVSEWGRGELTQRILLTSKPVPRKNQQLIFQLYLYYPYLCLLLTVSQLCGTWLGRPHLGLNRGPSGDPSNILALTLWDRARARAVFIHSSFIPIGTCRYWLALNLNISRLSELLILIVRCLAILSCKFNFSC
jgi:hypothetical protein